MILGIGMSCRVCSGWESLLSLLPLGSLSLPLPLPTCPPAQVAKLRVEPGEERELRRTLKKMEVGAVWRGVLDHTGGGGAVTGDGQSTKALD